ncbi:hypothetical protein G7Y89_g7210 [Cudoniella acicularis]|uniref:NACHT domain-containing protein n=1 Tax=Cudoniella acicularis TaxID=354080 RepID=A0A8H4RJS7_9HELO|nr:hypothetical protein G7Y89_g7210 [Cudoniella acicularis]
MDPFTAIGLAGNIIAFIDFGFEIVSTAKEIYNSTSGAASGNTDLKFLTDKFAELVLNLEREKPTTQMTPDELSLNSLAVECSRLSLKLQELLQNLKARKEGSKKAALGAVFRNMRKKKEKDELETKLENCRRQLHLHLTKLSRSETIQRLNQVLDSGKLHEKELVSLQHNVKILRSSLDAKHLSSGELDQIRSLLNPSDEALSKVYQNLILDGLRFEKMNNRFHDIKEAHLRTFSWILGKSDDDSVGNRSETDSIISLDVAETLSDSDDADSAHAIDSEIGSENAEGVDVVNANNDFLSYKDKEYKKYRRSRLEARDKFVDWLENGSRIFHISGKPGAGKSTLVKYLCQHPRTEKLLEGTEFQKSLKGLLRGLLHSILGQAPELIRSIFPKQWESAKYQQSIQFDESEILQAFKAILERDVIFGSHSFVFFIDGLDEFEGKHNDVVDMIRGLFRWVSARPSSIKVCVSSREELVFQERFKDCPKMRLHDLTHDDIATFVKETLEANENFQSINEGQKGLPKLQQLIIGKSEGVFLWARLAVGALEEGLLTEDRIEDLQKQIDTLPPEIDDLFEFIFDSITKHRIYRESGIRLLAIVENVTQNYAMSLPLTQYSFLEEYQDDRDFAIGPHVHKHTEEEMQQRFRRARKRVYAQCRGILEVVSQPYTLYKKVAFREEFVKLTHRSLAEFLQKKTTQERMAPCLVGFDIPDFYCQSLVAELKSINLDWSEYSMNKNSTFFYDISDRVRLYSYEIRNSSRLYNFLNQVADTAIANVPTGPTGYASAYMSIPLWEVPIDYIKCHPSAYIPILAVTFGMYEYLSTISIVSIQSLSRGEYDKVIMFALQNLQKPNSRNLVKILGYLFEYGISANSRHGFQRYTCLQYTLWVLISGTNSMHWESPLQIEPTFRVFLLYGTNPDFYLVFGPRNVSHKGEALIEVFPKSDKGGERLFDEVYVPKSDHIVSFAESKGWSLSLRDLVEYWFPKRYKVLQELIDRNSARQGCPGEKELAELKGNSQLDLDIERGITYEEDKFLFSYSIPPESRNFQITSTTLTTLRSLTAARPASTPWLDVAEHDISISMRDGHVNRARVFSPTSNLAPDQKSSAEDEGKQDGGRRPLFVMLYGGGFVMGRIEAEAEGLRRWVRKYGGVGVGIEHRHSPEHKFPGPIEDAHDAVKWISQNAKSLGADPTHGFILGGTSSGATAMTAISHLLRDEGHTPKVTGLLLSVPSMCVVLEIPERYREKTPSKHPPTPQCAVPSSGPQATQTSHQHTSPSPVATPSAM